jgi:hypothetical protein
VFNAIAVVSAALFGVVLFVWAYCTKWPFSLFIGGMPERPLEAFWSFDSTRILVIDMSPIRKVAEVSYWQMLALTAVVPMTRQILRRRRAFDPDKMCESCGYDLRATPERCPECGNIPSAAQTTSR